MKNNTTSLTGESPQALFPCPTKPSCHILVVDNDRDARRFSTQALVGSGYLVDAAEDGAVAWAALQTKAFNLLITDNKMPGLTGVELVRKLRSAHLALPVIMATGKLPTKELAQDPSLQMAALLPKPFSIEELLETVRVVLHDTNCATGQFEPLRNSQRQPSADGFRMG